VDLKKLLNEQKEKEKNRYEKIERQTLTAREISIYLGVSTHFIYKLVRQQKIPNAKIGSRVLFKKNTIDNWINELERNSVNH